IGQLRIAIDQGDLGRVREMITRNPSLHGAPLGYNKNGPLTWVAECRGIDWTKEGQIRLDMARWMIEHGSDVHQGGDGPLMRAVLQDKRIPMMELLVQYGADVNALWDGRYPIICAPCETLAVGALRWLLAHGADPAPALPMLIGTYVRNQPAKHACVEALIDAGIPLPDTPIMAFHRGRIDLLKQYVARDPTLLTRRFQLKEIFPPEVGIDETDALHLTPLEGVTLLHLAVDYDEIEIAEWLIGKADVNARASVDPEGFGGHTPLFHAVVTMGRHDDTLARLLLDHGADPNTRATIRKQLVGADGPEKTAMREFRTVTAISYARQFQEPAWVNEAAVELIVERGGVE
ncbi:MAG TPA: ankyrin repeat domain-containing protein, partial [Capsulimonadaceae bacterium]|nr:ankyrin repeat domain-containing protein [Capsulimonadaceae bacterium]